MPFSGEFSLTNGGEHGLSLEHTHHPLHGGLNHHGFDLKAYGE